MNPFRRFWRGGEAKPEPAYHPVRAECLVVEDDVEQADLLCGLLRMQNVLVTRAGNLAGALEVLKGTARFQLAFVDLNLPNGSGVEAVRLIKERRRMTHVVIVSGSPDKLIHALAYGYTGVILKPYAINTVREVLIKHRLPYAE